MKLRNGFVSNSSSSSFIIDANLAVNAIIENLVEEYCEVHSVARFSEAAVAFEISVEKKYKDRWIGLVSEATVEIDLGD